MKAKKEIGENIVYKGRKNSDKRMKGFYFMLLCMKNDKE